MPCPAFSPYTSFARRFQQGFICVDQFLRVGDLQLAAELEGPAPKGGAHLDLHPGRAGGLVHPEHLRVLAELVVDRADQLVGEAQRDLLGLAAEHLEGLLREGRDLLLWQLRGGAGRLVQGRDGLHPVHPVTDDLLILLAPAHQIVVVLHEDQGDGVHHVELPVLAVDLLVLFVEIEIVEGGPAAAGQRLLQLVDAEIDGLVGVLAGVEADDVLLQDLSPVVAAQGRDLLRELGGLFLRDEGRRLQRVDQDLQLGDAEPAVGDVVNAVPADFYGLHLVAVLPEQPDVRGDALALAGDAARPELRADLVGAQRMLPVRIRPQNLPQRQHLHLQRAVVGHKASPPVSFFAFEYPAAAADPSGHTGRFSMESVGIRQQASGTRQSWTKIRFPRLLLPD